MSGVDAETIRARCEKLLEDVRQGREDPTSPQAQQLLITGLVHGFVSKKDADAAADHYWDCRVKQCLEEVKAGKRDPDHPESQMLLDWGCSSKRITKKQRKDAVAAFKKAVGER